jgi:hypothetical protein
MSIEAWLTLLFSGLVAASTCVYAVLTWKLVTETRRMRRAQTDAKVGVSVVPSLYAHGFADLLVRNYGGGPATDVRFEIIEKEPGKGDPKTLEALQKFGFIKNGLDYMAPGWEYRTFLVAIVGRTKDQITTNIRLRVSYCSSSGEQHSEYYPIDLTHFWHRMRAGNPPLETVAHELEHIRKLLEQLLSNTTR